MNNKKVKTIAIIITALLVIGILGNLASVYVATKNGYNSSPFVMVHQIISVIVSALAVYYLDSGAKKGVGTKLYRYFIFAYILCLGVLLLIPTPEFTFVPLILGIEMSALSILAVAKDLGEVKSKILASVLIVSEILKFVLIMINNQGIVVKTLIFDLCCNVLIACTALFLVFAKYIDKKERGSK